MLGGTWSIVLDEETGNVGDTDDRNKSWKMRKHTPGGSQLSQAARR